MKIDLIRNGRERSRHLAGILPLLPQWFGNPEANKGFIRDVRGWEALAARDGKGTALGLIAMRYFHGHTAWIAWLGVRPEHHRHGIGTALLRTAVKRARKKRCRFMMVETLSARCHYKPYALTRKFYLKNGFIPLCEHDHWGKENPGTVMIKFLGR